MLFQFKLVFLFLRLMLVVALSPVACLWFLRCWKMSFEFRIEIYCC